MTEIKPWKERCFTKHVFDKDTTLLMQIGAMCQEIDELRAALAKVEQGEPVRPMSDEEREDAFSRLPNAKSGQFYYYLGIADAEAFHGIKGATE